MNLIISPNQNAKDLNEFIDFWSNQYYSYTNISDSIYNYCINSLSNNTAIKNAIFLIGAWKTNSINLYSKSENIAFKCSCGKTYYYTDMWKSGTSSAYDVWVNLNNDYIKHQSLLNSPEMLISQLESKKYNGSRAPNTKFGLTYAITYLHFLQPNKFPIFDKFVFLAVNFINSNQIQNIPYKIKNNNVCNYSDYINKYVNNFNIIKNCTSKSQRCIDKALWSFGHYITYSKKLLKPVCCKV